MVNNPRPFRPPPRRDSARIEPHLKAERKSKIAHADARVRAKCGKCGRVLAELLGSADAGLREIVGSEPGECRELGNGRAALTPSRGGFEPAPTRPHTMYVRAAAPSPPPGDKRTLTDLVDYLDQQQQRGRFLCHQRCGADVPFTRTKLDRAFREAVARGRRALYVPEDLGRYGPEGV